MDQCNFLCGSQVAASDVENTLCGYGWKSDGIGEVVIPGDEQCIPLSDHLKYLLIGDTGRAGFGNGDDLMPGFT